MIDLPPMNYQRVAAAVIQCGVPASHVRVRYEQGLELDVVIIERLGAMPSEPVLTCIYNAAVPEGYFVTFRDEEQNAAFSKVSMELGRERARQEGQEWLRARGLLDGLPLYDPGVSTPEGYAREVEKHCSAEPGSVIEVIDPKYFTLRRDFMESTLAGRRDDSDKVICIVNVLAASSLANGGISFGFVGNESYEKPRKHR